MYLKILKVFRGIKDTSVLKAITGLSLNNSSPDNRLIEKISKCINKRMSCWNPFVKTCPRMVY